MSSSKLKSLLASKTFHSVLGVTVSVILLVWVFAGVDYSKFSQQLYTANYWVLIPALFVFWLHFVLRAIRWRFLLPNGSKVGFQASFDSTIVGCFANFVLPLRAGEFVRPYMLSKITKVSFAEGFASIVTERFFDLVASIVTFAIILQFIPALPEEAHWVSTSAWILGGISVAILGFIVTVSLLPEKIVLIYDYLFPLTKEQKLTKIVMARLRRFLIDFISSAKILSSPSRLFAVLAMTALIWLSNYLLFYIFLYLLNIPQTFLLATVVSVVIALAVAAPSAPGFIGVYQTACVVAFALYKIPEAEALAFSIITHLMQYAVFIGYGVFALSRAGLKLKELRERSVEEVS
jgi:uncharacterized protein (TIRG00374 family)